MPRKKRGRGGANQNPAGNAPKKQPTGNAPKKQPTAPASVTKATVKNEAQPSTTKQEVVETPVKGEIGKALPKKQSVPNPSVKQEAVETPTKGEIGKALPKNLEAQLAQRPPRVPYGELRKCTVNHFTIQIGAERVFQHRIDFDPEIQSSSTKRQLLYSLSNILGKQIVYDGDSLFFSPQRIGDQVLNASARNKDYAVTVRCTNELNINDLSPQVFNVLCKKILTLMKLTPLGRQYYDPSRYIRISQHKIEVWPGYFAAIGSTVAGATLCLDIAHKILRTDSVLELMDEIRDARKINAIMDGQIVLTRYNNRTYRVDGVEWNETPMTTFTSKGKTCTFAQYYDATYNITIRDRKQPLLRIVDKRTKDVIFLVPELCYLTGLTDQMRADFKVMQALAEHTKIAPAQKFKELIDFSASISNSTDVKNGFSDWNLMLQSAPLKVEGRRLPPENMAVGTKNLLSAGDRAEWNNKSIIAPMQISKCLLVYPRNVSNEAKELVKQLDLYGKQFRMNFPPPKQVVIGNDRPASYVSAIKENIAPETNMVVCVLTRKGQGYDEIKVLCCKTLGVPSQCVLSKSMRNPKRIGSISSKIVQQINCKVGGELWRVMIPLKDMMIVGIDVCHDTTSDKGRGKRSVVGFCATTNADFTKYFSQVKFQGVGQEIVDELAACMEAAVENWKSLNGKYPSKVIIYRDGVGEGQFLEVLEYEVPQIKLVLQSKANIQFSEVIVQKRIHTRIFDHTRNLNNPTNPPPGTVIDNGCVSNHSYDFYMVSQNVTQGTATPTHYRIIHDEIALAPNHMQLLTFKLCHLYYNWAGTIRVPAPCQYAHKIAFLVGQSVHDVPHENLNNLLYFL